MSALLLALSGHAELHCTCPFSGKQDSAEFAFAVAIGGKADMTYCSANVR